jgi:Poly(A) polymerase catalytic subunit
LLLYTATMDLVIADEKEFENIALRHDPVYVGVENLVEVLLEFIRKHGLIIYGGLAIDYALRIFGDRLYPDDMLQIDYDFLSPNHIEHSYDLADAFYAMIKQSHGADEAAGVRAINALHVKTMRVDIRDNHFLADLTYCPASLFPKIPVLTYNGVKIIHPDMQRIDIHSSLSFPYDYPPTEVIFSRWKKDITRFKMLAKYYPLTYAGTVVTDVVGGKNTVSGASKVSSKNTVSGKSTIGVMTIPSGVKKYVMTGFSAYGLIYKAVAEKCGSVPGDIIRPDVGENMFYGSTLEIVHFNVEKCAEELKLAHTQRFRPVINMIPEILTGMAPFGKVKIDSTAGRLLSSVSVRVDGTIYRIACAQYLLRQFLAEYHYARMRDGPADIYLNHYVSLMHLMEYEHEWTKNNVSDAEPEDSNRLPVTRLSIVTYGSENVSLSKEVALKRVLTDIGKATSDYLPNNYHPAKKGENMQRPQYDITRNVIFEEAGEEIH